MEYLSAHSSSESDHLVLQQISVSGEQALLAVLCPRSAANKEICDEICAWFQNEMPSLIKRVGTEDALSAGAESVSEKLQGGSSAAPLAPENDRPLRSYHALLLISGSSAFASQSGNGYGIYRIANAFGRKKILPLTGTDTSEKMHIESGSQLIIASSKLTACAKESDIINCIEAGEASGRPERSLAEIRDISKAGIIWIKAK